MYIEHITTPGERFDQLAYKYYGSATDYERIVIANPSIPITPTLAGGLRVLIPIIDAAPVVDTAPWDR